MITNLDLLKMMKNLKEMAEEDGNEALANDIQVEIRNLVAKELAR